MTWTVLQTRRFSRQYKKLYDNTAADVDSAVDEVRQNPEIGERKKGDLSALRVFKFRSAGQLYLLGYTLKRCPPYKPNASCPIFAQPTRISIQRINNIGIALLAVFQLV